jgi:hypothetical protein
VRTPLVPPEGLLPAPPLSKARPGPPPKSAGRGENPRKPLFAAACLRATSRARTTHHGSRPRLSLPDDLRRHVFAWPPRSMPDASALTGGTRGRHTLPPRQASGARTRLVLAVYGVLRPPKRPDETGGPCELERFRYARVVVDGTSLRTLEAVGSSSRHLKRSAYAKRHLASPASKPC